MTALVIYESMFGSTRDVANAVAAGLATRMQVRVVEVSAAPTVLDEDLRLLVVGGPTHAFSMSRDSTRKSAAEQAPEGLVSTGGGIREWLDALHPGSVRPPVATFDTKVSKPKMPGSAAAAAEKRLRRLGFHPAVRHESFWVTGTKEPIAASEVDRARSWGEQLAAAVTART